MPGTDENPTLGSAEFKTVGLRIPIDHLEPDAASDELLVSRLTEELRCQIQSLVEVGLSDRESTWG